MNSRALGELALKIWGLMILLQTAAAIPATVMMAMTPYASDPNAGFVRSAQISSMQSLVVGGFLAASLIMWARPIANRLLPDTPPLQTNITSSELQALGFGLVGVWALLSGLQAISVAAYTLITKPAFDQTGTWEYTWQRQNEGIVRGVIQLAAGSILAFGRSGIAAGWARFQNSRVPQADD